jgi:hypothetical protein
MGGNKSHTPHRPSSSAKLYPPIVHHSHPSNYLLQQNSDLLASFSNPSFNFTPIPPKSNPPVSSSTQVNQKKK